MPLHEAINTYNPEVLKDGFNTLENGEEIEGMNSLEDTLLFIKENIWSLIDKNDIIRFGPDVTRGGGEAPF
jgi:hypothetical protein